MFYGVLFTVPTTSQAIASIGAITNPVLSELIEYWYILAAFALIGAFFTWIKLK